MRENTNQKNSVFGHFLCRDVLRILRDKSEDIFKLSTARKIPNTDTFHAEIGLKLFLHMAAETRRVHKTPLNI